MEGTTVSATEVLGSVADNVGELLNIGLDVLNTLITNPVVLLFLSMSVLMFAFHIVHSARKMF